MSRKTKLWLHGLAAALVSAIGDTGSAVLGSMVFAPGLLHDGGFWRVLAGTIAFSALKTVFAYLRQNPVPGGDDDGG